MPDNCSKDCPYAFRIEANTEAIKQAQKTHDGIFERLRKLEQENAVQDAHYNSIMEKLNSMDKKHDEFRASLKELESKPADRWNTFVIAAISAVVGGVISVMITLVFSGVVG